jgi:hypothetical protein
MKQLPHGSTRLAEKPAAQNALTRRTARLVTALHSGVVTREKLCFRSQPYGCSLKKPDIAPRVSVNIFIIFLSIAQICDFVNREQSKLQKQKNLLTNL